MLVRVLPWTQNGEVLDPVVGLVAVAMVDMGALGDFDACLMQYEPMFQQVAVLTGERMPGTPEVDVADGIDPTLGLDAPAARSG